MNNIKYIPENGNRNSAKNLELCCFHLHKKISNQFSSFQFRFHLKMLDQLFGYRQSAFNFKMQQFASHTYNSVDDTFQMWIFHKNRRHVSRHWRSYTLFHYVRWNITLQLAAFYYYYYLCFLIFRSYNFPISLFVHCIQRLMYANLHAFNTSIVISWA